MPTTQSHGLHIEQGAHNNHIGGTSPADRNVISGNGRSGVGIWHEGTDNNVIYNNIVGLSPRGDRRLSNLLHGIDVNFGVSFSIIGGTQPGQHNVVSGNNFSGIEMSHEAGTSQNQVVGNYVGTDLTGNQITFYSYNALKGISIKDRASNNTVSQNVVGSNKQGGIVLDNLGQGVPTGNRILNNRVGISRNGTAISNVLSGIHIISAQTTVIGPGNIVANNPVGIQIDGTGSDRNKITRNSIYNNTNLGIDLAPTGVTPNDSGDGDSGPNEQLNFPVLQTASTQQVTGTACGGCTVEIFIADSGANSYGEGKTFVGSAVTSSNGIFKVNVGGVTQGQFVTATATDTAGNTSEFSLNARIQ
jgi:hypothetical protein